MLLIWKFRLGGVDKSGSPPDKIRYRHSSSIQASERSTHPIAGHSEMSRAELGFDIFSEAYPRRCALRHPHEAEETGAAVFGEGIIRTASRDSTFTHCTLLCRASAN